MDKDVTKLVEFYDSDGEHLPLIKCVCGRRSAAWDNILSIYRDAATKCPDCGRALYFKSTMRVLERGA